MANPDGFVPLDPGRVNWPDRHLFRDVSLFASDATPVEQLVEVINLYATGLVIERENTRYNSLVYFKHFLVASFEGPSRNIELICRAKTFFGFTIEIDHSLYHQCLQLSFSW